MNWARPSEAVRLVRLPRSWEPSVLAATAGIVRIRIARLTNSRDFPNYRVPEHGVFERIGGTRESSDANLRESSVTRVKELETQDFPPPYIGSEK